MRNCSHREVNIINFTLNMFILCGVLDTRREEIGGILRSKEYEIDDGGVRWFLFISGKISCLLILLLGWAGLSC